MKKLIIIFLFFSLNVKASEIFHLIKQGKSDLSGYLVPQNADYLKKFISQIKPKVVVDLGVWLGKSSFFMAKLLDKNAKLYAIDPWLDYKDIQNIPEMKERMPRAYYQFLTNCKNLGLTKKIIPIRMTSLEAANYLNIKPDLIYIDASHEEVDVYNDIMAWYPKINKGGICCGDDWATYTGVSKAVMHAATTLGVKYYSYGNIWYFDPKP